MRLKRCSRCGRIAHRSFTDRWAALMLSIGIGMGPLISIQKGPLRSACLAGSARGVGAGWCCGDGASAGCLIVVAAFKMPAVVTGLDDVTVMGQAVEQRGRHLGIAEHARPFAECQIGGDDDGGALVEPADEVEQELAAGLAKGR